MGVCGRFGLVWFCFVLQEVGSQQIGAHGTDPTVGLVNTHVASRSTCGLPDCPFNFIF